jgi:hypothetical protein
MLTPNRDQVMSAIRWAVSSFGMFIAGWFASKGWFTVDQVMSVLNNETVMGFIASAIVFVIGQVVHRTVNKIVSADATPGVAGVITTNTPEGRALAASVPSSTVVPAGTPAATAIAKAA